MANRWQRTVRQHRGRARSEHLGWGVSWLFALFWGSRVFGHADLLDAVIHGLCGGLCLMALWRLGTWLATVVEGWTGGVPHEG